MSEAKNGSALYAEFVQEQVTSEEARKLSLEQRGLAVITSSGVLATFAFGALALVKRGDKLDLPGPSVPLLVTASAAFLLAAALALATNFPLRHRAVAPMTMLESVREHWGDDQDVARARITATRAGLLAALRQANNKRSLLLLAALSSEVIGVAALASAVGVVLLAPG